MEEAGQIDGCNVFQTFIKLVVPLSKPGIASIIIFTFIGCWNEFMTANIFLKTQGDENHSGWLAGVYPAVYHRMGFFDGGVLYCPDSYFCSFLIFMQKYIVAGLTSGAVKG